MAIARSRNPLAWLHQPTQKRQDYLTVLLCLLPWIIGFLCFTIGPILYSFGLSFFEADLLTQRTFVGFTNYTSLFRDPLFLKSLRVTATYAFASVPLGVIVALGVAMLLNQKIVGLSVWRTIYYMPSLISGVAVSVLWLQIFNPRMGLINSFLARFGIQGPAWIFDSNWALPSLLIMSIWGVGATMLLYLAGLQGIPTELYEAAELDGAGHVRKFVNITVPMLTPTIFFNSLIGLIAAFQLFTQVRVMTQGGPNNATLTMVLFLYRKAFEQTRFGYASAVAWILFAIIIVFTIIYVRFSDRWVFYAGQDSR